MKPVEVVEKACVRAQELAAAKASRREVLECLISAAEHISAPDAVSSILLLDEEGLLRNGASPNLPDDYLQAIDRLKPHPRVGTCAAAAATGLVVETPDFLADDKWAELRHLPISLGFVGAWSMPIKSPRDGRVLGTFGTYFRQVRMPSQAERESIGRLASAAALALDHV